MKSVYSDSVEGYDFMYFDQMSLPERAEARIGTGYVPEYEAEKPPLPTRARNRYRTPVPTMDGSR